MGVYTVAGGKGGVGKTTTAATLAVTLCHAGYDVGLVDADLATANLAKVLGVEPERGVHHVLAGRADVRDVLVEASSGVRFLPGATAIEMVEAADPANLRQVVAPLAEALDVVLVDTGAGLTHGTLVAMGLADGVLVVTTPDAAAVDDAARTVAFGDHADADVLGAVVTRTDERTDLGAVAAELGVPVLGAIPEDDAVGSGPVTTGEAGAAYRRLAAALAASELAAPGAVSAPASVDWTPAPSECDETATDPTGRLGPFSFAD